LLGINSPDNLSDPLERSALRDLASAVAFSDRPRPALKKAAAKRSKKKRAHKSETSDIRAEVFARALNVCELCKGTQATDLQHTMGRVKRPQAVGNTVALCRPCHILAGKKSPEVVRRQGGILLSHGYARAASDLFQAADWLESKTAAREKMKARRLVSLDEELRIERAPLRGAK
jgi:hypothetical protein